MPPIFSLLEDADLPPALREDNGYAASGLPTEEALLPDEQRFQQFVLPSTFVTKESLRENERERRRRKRESVGKTRES